MNRHDYVMMFSLWNESTQEKLLERTFEVRTNFNEIASFALNYVRFDLTERKGLWPYVNRMYYDDYDQKCFDIRILCDKRFGERIDVLEELLDTFVKMVECFETALAEKTLLSFYQSLMDKGCSEDILMAFTLHAHLPINLIHFPVFVKAPLKDFNIAIITQEGVNVLRSLDKDKIALSTFEVAVEQHAIRGKTETLYAYHFQLAIQASEETVESVRSFYADYFKTFADFVS